MTNQYSTQFQTPPEIAKYMASLIPEGAISILEPTPGQGNIIRELKDYNVSAPDDFFTIPKNSRFDSIVMNPPFSSKYAFNVPQHLNKNGMRLGYYILTECMQMSDSVIALMPWFTLSDSDIRMRNIKRWGLKSITALPRKTFSFARIQTCILELNKGYVDNTAFKVYDLLKPDKQVKLCLNTEAS